MRRFLVSIVSIVLLVLANGCARQGYPTGGPKDEEPPVALGCKPANESRHFADNKFYIQFDEYVVLKNPDNNVIISPPMKHKPEFSLKGKALHVKLKDTLQEGATYLFQFKGGQPAAQLRVCLLHRRGYGHHEPRRPGD